MGNGSDRSDPAGPDATERRRSIGYELLVWVFLVPPVGLLGVTAADAIAGSAPVSWTGALVLVGGLAVVGSALLSDFQPSLLAAFGFFVLDQFLLGFLYFTGQTMVLQEPGLSPLAEVGLQALAIAIAAVVAFTNVGRGSERLDRLVRRLLRLPPGDRSGAVRTTSDGVAERVNLPRIAPPPRSSGETPTITDPIRRPGPRRPSAGTRRGRRQ